MENNSIGHDSIPFRTPNYHFQKPFHQLSKHQNVTIDPPTNNK